MKTVQGSATAVSLLCALQQGRAQPVVGRDEGDDGQRESVGDGVLHHGGLVAVLQGRGLHPQRVVGGQQFVRTQVADLPQQHGRVRAVTVLGQSKREQGTQTLPGRTPGHVAARPARRLPGLRLRRVIPRGVRFPLRCLGQPVPGADDDLPHPHPCSVSSPISRILRDWKVSRSSNPPAGRADHSGLAGDFQPNDAGRSSHAHWGRSASSRPSGRTGVFSSSVSYRVRPVGTITPSWPRGEVGFPVVFPAFACESPTAPVLMAAVSQHWACNSHRAACTSVNSR